MIRTKKFENLPQITSISPSGKIVVTENGVDKVISFEDFSNLPPANDVWNNASTTFTASEVNVTDIQSAADSKLLDLKINTVSKFVVRKDGNLGIGVVNPAARLDISDTVLAGSGSLAGSILNLAQTWNTTGAPTAIKLNVTNTSSGAASNLLDLQLDNISRFRITKGGVIDFGPSNNAFFRSAINCGAGQLVTFTRSDVPDRAYAAGGIYNGSVGGLFLGSGLGLQWSSGSFADGGGYDLTLIRRAAANLNLGSFDAAAPVAQTLSVQSVVAGTSNTAGANFTIDGSRGTGTGVGGSIIFRTAKATTSSSTVNSLTEALTIDSERNITIGGAYNDFSFKVPAGGGSRSFSIIDGVNRIFQTSTNGLVSVGYIAMGASTPNPDIFFQRDAANTLALRNGVNPQTFRLYNTYTDASNYERSFLKWDTNEFIIGTERNGTGSNRDLRIVSSSQVIKFGNSTNNKVTITNPWVDNFELAIASTGSNSLISYTANIYQNFVINGNILNGAFNFNIDGSKFDIRQGGITFGKVVSDNKVKLFGAGGDFGNDGGKTIDFYTGGASGANTNLDLKGGDFTFGLGRGHGGGSLPKFTFKTRLGSIRGTDHAEYDLLTLQARDIGIGTTTPLAKLDISETWNSNISVTGATGTGSVATITFATQAAAIPVGATVVVSSVNPSGYNGTFVVTASTVTSISYTNSTSTTYVSGGTVQQLFTAVKVNVTDTASNANSLLMDLQVGGASKFKVDKTGIITNPYGYIGQLSSDLLIHGGSNNTYFTVSNGGGIVRAAVVGGYIGGGGFAITNNGSLMFSSISSPNWSDTFLLREAANTLVMRNGVNPQTSRIYGTYTDVNNYARLAISCDTSGNAILATEGLGTGAAGTISIGNTNKIILGTSAGVDLAFRATDSTSVGFRIGSGNTLEIVRSDAGAYANITANNITIQGTLSTLYAPINSNVNVAGTTGEHVALIASSSSNGTAANGFGTRIVLRTESSTTAARDSGAISSLWSDATDATRTSDLLFYNALNGTLTERMRILGSNGNVGIGTNAPAAKLQINLSNATPEEALRFLTTNGNLNNGSYISFFSQANELGRIKGLTTSGGSNIGQILLNPVYAGTELNGIKILASSSFATVSINTTTASSGLTIKSPYNGATILSLLDHADIEKFTVLNSGNLGIGTTTPTSKLHIAGPLGSNTSTYDSEAALRLTNTTGDSSWILTSGIIGVLNANFCIRYSGNSTPAFVISNQVGYSNNVGIQVNNPNARLDIADTTLAGSGSLAGSILNLAQTWNTTGAPTAIKLNVTNTASGADSNLLDLQVGGVSKCRIDKNGAIISPGASTLGGLTIGSGILLSIAGGHIRASNGTAINLGSADSNSTDNFANLFLRSSAVVSFGGDAKLFRDDANALAQRNGVNSQSFRLYNTYTDASNYERGFFGWSNNILTIATDAAGVAVTNRSMSFSAGGQIGLFTGAGWPIYFAPGGSIKWNILSSGHFLAATDNVYDIGANGATRPRSGYFGTSIVAGAVIISGNQVSLGNSAGHLTLSGTQLQLGSGTTTYVTLFSGTVGSPLLAFGGVSSSFPAIKRNGAALQIRLADDSANAALETAGLTVVGNASVSGHFSAATKSFLIDHPTKEGKKLQYGVVESNQHSVLVRGKTAENIIELPEEWAGLVHEDSVTVQLTPIGSYQQLFVISQDNQRVVVGGSTGQYNYTIYGERKDVDKLITEI